MEELEPPRFEEFGPIRIAGLGESLTEATAGNIPALWRRFDPYWGNIAGQIGGVSYGVLIPKSPDQFDYVCGVEVSDFSKVPVDFVRMELQKQRYAVFSHRGPLSALRSTMHHIWNKWLPESKRAVSPAPRLERYSEDFRPNKPGGIEIWIPLKEQ